jgi:hypothetical protein
MPALYGSWIAALPGGDAGLVALGVGQHPERGRLGVVAEPAARGQGCRDATLRLVVRHADVEVDPVALGPGCVHLLEPDGRPLPELIHQRVLGSGGQHFVLVAHDRHPERPDCGDVQRVDRDLHHLRRPWRARGDLWIGDQALRGDERGDLAGQLGLPRGGRRGSRAEGDEQPLAADVQSQAVPGVGVRGGELARELAGLPQRPGAHAGTQHAEQVTPAQAGDRVGSLLPG